LINWRKILQYLHRSITKFHFHSYHDYVTPLYHSEQLLTLYGGTAADHYVQIGDGGDVNFKVRSNTDDYNIWSDGGTNKVGIGTGEPSHKLTVEGDISASGDFLGKSTSTGSFGSVEFSGNLSGSITSTGSFGHIMISGSNFESAVSRSAAASGFGAGGLDEANNLTVSGGNVDTAEAADIQSISGYDGSASDYDITDTAAALISAGDNVLDVDACQCTGDIHSFKGMVYGL